MLETEFMSISVQQRVSIGGKKINQEIEVLRRDERGRMPLVRCGDISYSLSP